MTGNLGFMEFDLQQAEAVLVRTPASLLDEFSAMRASNLEQLSSWRRTPEMLRLASDHPEM